MFCCWFVWQVVTYGHAILPVTVVCIHGEAVLIMRFARVAASVNVWWALGATECDSEKKLKRILWIRVRPSYQRLMYMEVLLAFHTDTLLYKTARQYRSS